VAAFGPDQVIFRQGDADRAMHVVLQGEVSIKLEGAAAPVPVGVVKGGECLGEMSLLTAAPHSATATARTPVETAVLSHEDLTGLIRLRPDIGVSLYKNLAIGLGEKLKRSGAGAPALASQG
jgi:CRP-like cAMP-binding protein